MKQELNIILLLAAISILLGLISGHFLLFICLGLVIYAAHHLWQANSFVRWFNRALQKQPPVGRGVWSEISDDIYRRDRKHRKRYKNLHTLLGRFRRSSKALRDGVILTDKDGNIAWVNPAAQRLLSLRDPEDIGLPIINLLRDPNFIRYLEKADYEQPLRIQYSSNNNVLDFQVTEYGNSELLIFVRDVSRIIHLENMRKDFVANVSHELRTPLTVLTGYLETAKEHQEGLPDNWQRIFQQMDQQTQRMNALVNDLMQLSNLENGAVEDDVTPVDIKRLLERLINEATTISAAKQHQITLSIETDMNIVGIESELYSAFSNLIVNAINYSPAGSSIGVVWKKESHGVCLSVQDEGIGILPQHIPRLTERFYRVDKSRSTQSGGTGLGLAIVKHILNRHQGHLSIESQEGKGSCFTCHFPAEQIVSDLI